MADISILSRLIGASERNVDISSNTLVTLSIKVGGGVSNTELTKAILDRLVALQNGSDVDATYHTHDSIYYRKTQINSSTGGSAGSTLVGDDDSYANITPSPLGTLKGTLSGIDAALGAGAAGVFDDFTFRIFNHSDSSKHIAFSAASISPSTTRTISMPDSNVNLALVGTAIQRDGSVAFTANQPMGGFKLTGLAAGSATGDSVRYEQAILISGVNPFAANQPMGGFKLTGLGAGTTAGDSVRYEQAILTSGANPFAANQPMGGFKLTGLTPGSTTGDSVSYEQAILASGVNPFTADQSLGSHKLTNLSDPTSPQDAATKAYVDAISQGLRPKAAVEAGSLANVNLASMPASLDGVTLSNGDRILIKNQTSTPDNGIYIFNGAGSAATRSPDMDSLSPIDEINGAYTFIQNGSQAGQGWVEQSKVTVLGTDPMVWVYFNSVSTLIGGDMITVVGSTISVDLATVSGLESSNPGNPSGQLRIKLEALNPSLQFSGSNELGIKFNPAGALLSGASGTAVQVDNSTIEINTNALRVKDAGITLAKLASNSVDENKIVSTAFDPAGAISGGSGTKIKSNVDNSTIEINTNALRVKDAGITAAKLNTNAFDQSTITGGGGSAAVVQNAPLVQRTLVAGESFASDTSFLVRWAINGETAGRVYKADKDATTFQHWAVIGLARSVAGVSAGGNINVVILGEASLGANDAVFSAGNVGLELFLGSSGAFILGSSLSNASNEAQVCVGVIENTTKVWVDFKQLRGIT
jgi:hypothetical protein